MKVSIITAAFNCSRTVLDCISSVEKQSYQNIEHIIIDGASSDDTIKIINSHANRIHTIISEPDVGLYDALNKGIALATGDIIGFLHTDDIFYSNETISQIVSAFQEGGSTIAGTYGDLVFVCRKNPNKVRRYWESSPFQVKALSYGWMPPHPTLFLRREIYETFGSFHLPYKIAADYDFIIRIMKDTNLEFHYIPGVVTIMKTGGISNKNIINILKKSIEDVKVADGNKIGGLFTVICKNLRKLKQLFIRQRSQIVSNTKLIRTT